MDRQELIAMNEAKMLNLFVQDNTIKQLFMNPGRGDRKPGRGDRKPVLVVKYGPPASGKGSPPTRAAIESLGVQYNKMIHFNVDDVIESLNKFKGASRSQLEKTFTYLTNSARVKNNQMKQLEANLNKIGDHNIKDFSKIYFETRNTPMNNKGTKVGDLMDSIMGRAMEMSLDISMETTGSFSFPDWLFSEPKLQPHINNYRVVFVFPTVKCGTAWSRYKSRPIKSYESGGPFRFGSTKTGFATQYINSYKAFINKMPNFMVGKDVSYIIVPNDPSNAGKPASGVIKNNSLLPKLEVFITDAEEFRRSASTPTTGSI